MSRHTLGRYLGMLTTAAALAVSLGAQAQSQPPPPQQTSPAMAAPAAVTIEGCLLREEDVPGRKPNVAEKAGVLEDYIVTDVKFVKGSAPTAAAAGEQPVGTSGMKPMYEVRGIDDETLKKHAGQRVEIEGTISPKDVKERQQTEAQAGAASKNDLPEIQATAIRPASGPCSPGK